MSEQSVIQVKNLTKSYGNTEVLRGVSLDIEQDKLTVLVGPSGSGKTTLLDTMSSITRPDSGSIHVKGFELKQNFCATDRFISGVGKFMRMSKIIKPAEILAAADNSWVDITKLNEKQRASYLAKNGQIFQQSGLLSGLTAKQNIESVHVLSDKTINEEWVGHLAELLEVKDLMKKRVSTLSGGQAQRIGIIRALAHKPELIFADEPTASLNPDLKDVVHNALHEITKDGASVVLVSHEPSAKDYADRVVEVSRGAVKAA